MRAFEGEVEHQSLVVIYDPDTGDVVHRHEVVSVKGAQHPDDRTIESDAWDELDRGQPTLARRLGGPASGLRERLAILHADPTKLDPDKSYRVDTKKRALVERPAEDRPRK